MNGAGRDTWSEGLGDEALRRPMTPSGTSLLGLVKHLAGAEYGWFCDTFGRDREPLPFDLDSDIEADMRAAPGESTEDIRAGPGEAVPEWLSRES